MSNSYDVLSNIIGLTAKFKEYYKADKIRDEYPIKKIKGLKENEFNEMMYIFGNHGNGKSFAIQWFLCELKKKNNLLKIQYITMTKLIMNLYAKSFEDKVKYINILSKEYDILAIDEIEKIKLTEYKEEMIFYLLDERINNMKKTIMAGNDELEKLEEKLQKNIISRILSNCLILKNEGRLLR
jgi:DNA replication protein DnaC